MSPRTDSTPKVVLEIEARARTSDCVGRMDRLIVAALLLCVASPARAQSPATPADGLYEDFPSLFMEASGPLSAPPTALARWVDVRTRGRITTVTFEPDARVTWRVRWGPHGPTEKETLVDGQRWTRSVFGYDAAGHLATKRVTGPGAPGGYAYAYVTDPATGEVISRTTTLTAGGITITERVDVARTARGVTVHVHRDGSEVRRDRYDAQHRLLETRLYDAHGREVARLGYARDPQGALRTVTRRIGAHRGASDPHHPDLTLTSADVAVLARAPIERHEALLWLGAPTVSNDEGRGTARVVHTDFAPSACWLDQTSGLEFDATGLLARSTVGCICGFCVDASLPRDDAEAQAARSIQEHWTRGPWVRIDGAIDVTSDHALVTPEGPRRAGALRVGDVVTRADGSPHVIASLELLADDGPRLGVNLVTAAGTFAAGGLRFVSETPGICPTD